MKFAHLFFVFSIALLSGCGGTRVTSIDDCITPTSLISTKEVLFYSVEITGGPSQYSSDLDKAAIKNYLCFYDEAGKLENDCVWTDRQGGVLTALLPTGSEISLDGSAKKTKMWGTKTLLQDFPQSTWFKGFADKRAVWVNSNTLHRLFEDNKDFNAINSAASKSLKFDLVAPANSFHEQLTQIADWDCTIK